MAILTSAGAAPRVAALHWSPYSLPFVTPFQTAHERLALRTGFLIHARDSAGRSGYGEAAPLAGFGMESLDATALALQEWGPRITGLTLTPMPGHSYPEALRALEGLAGAPAARHGLECALADLAAQAEGVPLHVWMLRCLGISPSAKFPTSIGVNATLGALSPDLSAEHSKALSLEGFTTLKVKVGVGGPEADTHRVQAIRRAVPTLSLRVDANGAWDEATALNWLRANASLSLEYAEQPIARGDLRALARLAAVSPVPIAADESVQNAEDVSAVLSAHAAQILILKPMALGGPLVAVQAARRALHAGIPVVITTVLEGAYGRAAAVHTAAAVQSLSLHPLPAMGLATGHLLREDLVEAPARPSLGRLPVPNTPGIGLGNPRFI